METLREHIAARRAATYNNMPRTLVRAGIALAQGRGSKTDARIFANQRRESGAWWDSDVGDLLDGLTDARAAEQWITKADVTAMDENVVTAGREFVQWVYPTTILGQLPQARRIPFGTVATMQGGATIAQWAGEATAKIVVEARLANASLFPRKTAAITPVSLELIEVADPNTEDNIGLDLKAGVATSADGTFASADAEVPGVSPAGIFANVPTVPSSGASQANIKTDVKALISTFRGNGNSMDGAVFIMSEDAVSALNSEGIATNTLTVAGGTLFGVPVIVSSSMAADSIGLLASRYVVFALGDLITLSTSRHATLDMAGGNTPNYSLFQRNAIALRAEMYVNWMLAGGPRDSNDAPLGAVLLTGATWA